VRVGVQIVFEELRGEPRTRDEVSIH
jgi:hypothetical protein